MSYATSQDIIARLGAELYLRLFDRDGDGAADTQIVNEAIAHADACIDVELRGVYTLPLPSPVAVHVKDIAVDLAIGRVVRGTPFGSPTTGAYAGLYEAAERRLRRLREIGGTTLAPSEGTREDVSFVIADKRRPSL